MNKTKILVFLISFLIGVLISFNIENTKLIKENLHLISKNEKDKDIGYINYLNEAVRFYKLGYKHSKLITSHQCFCTDVPLEDRLRIESEINLKSYDEYYEKEIK